MLKNFWYVAELGVHITRKPRRVTLLGQDFVLFRGTEGQVIALSDLCVHRGASLSGGEVDGNCIRCPYHGWRFQADGACNEIPANPKGSPVPQKARLDAYPVQEHYGWVWIFLGDLPPSERPPIPTFPEFSYPDWRPIYGEFLWKANYVRVVENAVDVAHLPFVHGGSFGNRNEPEIPRLELEQDDWNLGVALSLRPPPPKGLWKYIRSNNRPDVKAATRISMPNITRLDVDLGKFRFVLVGSHVPLDDHTTLTRWIQVRNFFTGSWADGDAHKRTLKIFLEDQVTVEGQRPELVPYDIGAELHVKSDSLQIAYRRMRNQALDRGWGIDTRLIREQYAGRSIVNIPSPPRKELQSMVGNWVFEEVPVRKPG